MNIITIILWVVVAVLLALSVGLFFLEKKYRKAKEQQDDILAKNSQWMTLLIIDKKRCKADDSGLPNSIKETLPKAFRRMKKLAIVKAKVGPKIISFIADESIFDDIPVGKEISAFVGGLYISEIRGIRGPIERSTTKKGFRARMAEKYNQASKELKEQKKKK
ncbi:hypothetical protein [Lachnobacterium bovis]|uniref:Uncharacterized protein n=1 Tax=Lachnobacterium bovis TaxID=140626 RepID=A0A1H9U2Y0_9FIRM|nr:hypothetical protein [Lachnobacterium bovis]SES03598.1 hypothetical protein SAMN02910429_01899 [Lachnobacterium bovis]